MFACGGYALGKGRPGAIVKVPKLICGHWVVKRALTWDTYPNPKFMGLQVEYSLKTMKFGEETMIKDPVYLASKWSSDKFSENLGGDDLSDIGIKKGWVTVVQVFRPGKVDPDQASAGPGALIFIRNKHQIVVLWNGAYYLLDRTKQSVAHSIPNR